MHRTIVIVVAGVLLGACGNLGGGSESSPGPAGSEPSSTAPSTAPSPSVGASAEPSPASLSVVVGPDSVAGWWDGTRFVQAGSPETVPVDGSEVYTVIGLDGVISTSAGSAVEPGCEPMPESSRIEVPGLMRDFRDPLEDERIAVAGVGDPRPRGVQKLPSSTPYVQAAADLLEERGLTGITPQVVQVVKSDLDGDGRDEVIVVAESIQDSTGLFARPGDYSIIFVRAVVDGEVVTSVPADSIAKDEPPGVTPFIESHRLAAVADLNGDGTMELAVAGRYYEGASVTFHELGGDGRVREVLSSGCGA